MDSSPVSPMSTTSNSQQDIEIREFVPEFVPSFTTNETDSQQSQSSSTLAAAEPVMGLTTSSSCDGIDPKIALFQDWACRSCTVANPPHESRCQVCRTPRDKPWWTCATCTYANSRFQHKCEMCAAKNPNAPVTRKRKVSCHPLMGQSGAPSDIIPFAVGWDRIRESFDDLVDEWQQDCAVIPVDRLELMLKAKTKGVVSEVYDVVFNMCIQREPFNHSEQLYTSMHAYLTGKFNTWANELRALATSGVAPSVFLESWARTLARCLSLVKLTKGSLTYLDRFFVPNSENTPTINAMACRLLLDHLVDPFVQDGQSGQTDSIRVLAMNEASRSLLDEGQVSSGVTAVLCITECAKSFLESRFAACPELGKCVRDVRLTCARDSVRTVFEREYNAQSAAVHFADIVVGYLDFNGPSHGQQQP